MPQTKFLEGWGMGNLMLSYIVQKLDMLALLVADPPNATLPLDKINPFQMYHFTMP